MSEAIKNYTPSGKIKRPFYSLVANWIKESWDAIDPNMIMHSFKCCGISNAINGTEDNLIFDFNKVNRINNLGRGIEGDDKENERNEGESDDNNGRESDYNNDNESGDD